MNPGLWQVPASIEQFVRLSAGGSLYAVLDACDEPAVPLRCEALKERAVSLYRGSAAVEYAHVAPYLVTLDPDVLEWIAEQLWEKPWGIFVYCDAGQDAVRQHLRRFLQVRLPNGSQVLFRFYDPRVLRTFLDSSDANELRSFFGPIKGFGVSDADGDNITLFRIRAAG